MPGTVTIAARPRFAGGERLRVRVDGAIVGRIRSGGCFELCLEDGDHVFRLSAGGFRSRTVALRVADGDRLHLDGGQRGWMTGLFSVAGAATAAAWFDHHRLVALVLVLAMIAANAMPGTAVWLRVATLTPDPDPESESRPDAALPDRHMVER